MTAVGELVLILGLLVTAHCAVRARDPGVEEEEDQETRGWKPGVGGGHAGGVHLPSAPHGHGPDAGAGGRAELPPLGHGDPQDGHGDGHPPLGTEEDVAPLPGEGGNYPARTGNWCAFVSRRVVSTAVACGTEKYTIKSQSPCPNGTPDCQLVMYKLSTRPVYREKQKIFTALLWRCCPGHTGDKCEETVAEGQVSDPGDLALTTGSLPVDTEPHLTGVPSRPHHLAGDRERVQNDFQLSVDPLYDAQPLESNHDHESDTETTPHPGHEYVSRHDNHQPQHPHRHQPHHHGVPNRDLHNVEVDPYPETPSPLPVPHMMALIMAHLQPVLEGFNRTLERLTQEVGALSRDMAQLKITQWERQGEALEGAPELHPADLEETSQGMEEVRRQLDIHQAEVQDRLHSQHVMLHHNLTSIKTDMDIKLKRNHKMLQVNLQSMNATLSDMRLEQERLNEELQRGLTILRDDRRTVTHAQVPRQPPHQNNQPPEGLAVWEAIARLDNKVVNNTVKVNSMVEDLDVAQENIQDLKKAFRGLEEDIAQTRRNSQIQFMETGLEVEAAKVTVINSVSELAKNLSMHIVQVQELDSDVDYLYSSFYKNMSIAADCDCKGFALSIANLKQGLANVTELANDNRLALDASSEAGSDSWGTEGVWGPSVEDLHQGLEQVRASLAFEQEQTRTLRHNVSQLVIFTLGSQKVVASLRETDVRLQGEMRHLASSFASLLKDALRHTDVLETLLGEEVLEFLDWPSRSREAHSIPALKDVIQHMQEQIRAQNLSLNSLLGGADSDSQAADQPSVLVDWASRGLERRSGDQRRDHQLLESEDIQDYSDSDLWSLEKSMEELRIQVRRLEERPCPVNCNHSRQAPPSGQEAKLQAEVAWLRRGLEDHLRIFKNVFSNSEGLEASEGTVDLDKLWAMLKRKEGKKMKKEKKEGRRVNGRSRRNTSVHSELQDGSLLFLADSFSRVSEKNRILFESTSLNHDQAYSATTGVFQAPVDGVYFFVLTLDFKPGPTLVGLKRESGSFAIRCDEEATGLSPVTRVGLLQLEEDEEIYLELLKGSMETEYPGKSSFAGLLLHRTT